MHPFEAAVRQCRIRLGILLALLALNLGPTPLAPALALGLAATWWLSSPAPGLLKAALALAYAVLVGGALAMLGDPDRGLALGLRLGTGALAGLTFGSGAEEAVLREVLRRLRMPRLLLENLDQALLHGRLLAHTLARRQEASRLRQGGFPGTALALAGGVERSLVRSFDLEEVRHLREAPCAGPSAGSGQPVLEVSALQVRHPEGGGLSDLDLRLAPGEWVALLGPSGSGKSTFLRAVAGLLKPASGQLLRHGREGAGRPDGRTGLVFQDPEDQLLASTPLEDAAWGLERRGLAPQTARQAASDLLQALGLADQCHRPFHRLSHGERKRAAFASALVLKPDLLLLDEPTAGLDPRAARQLVDLLEAHIPHASVLWATHDLHHLPRRIQRVLVLQEGRPFFLGDRHEALSPDVLQASGLA